jgi:hypothetical protein
MRLSRLTAIAALFLTGCVSDKYEMLGKEAKPVVPLALMTTADGLNLTVTTLIFHDGPGAWKRHALWDEYVVKLENHGSLPASVESAVIISAFPLTSTAGTEPWSMEKLSRGNVALLQQMKVPVLLGSTPSVGDVALGVTGMTIAAAFTTPVSLLLPAAAGGALVYGGAVALMVYAPFGLTTRYLIDPKHRKAVEQEFDRRRLKLPLTIAPGATTEGSFFFPVTPGPQRLIVKGWAGEAPLELVLDLKLFAGLHLRPAGKG